MSYAPAKLSLVDGKIRRGDTVEAWPFTISGVPSPDDAVITFSLHLATLDSDPLIALDSDSEGSISVTVTDDVISGEVPRINIPAVGKLLWEVQARVPTLDVAGPTGGKWNRTIFTGEIVAVQDGAERELP